MLVLFSSAYRPGYVRNVLRTMLLPNGAANEYRYSIGSDLHISEELVSSIEKLGEVPVLICFADRYSPGGYTFYPVRRGVLRSVSRSGGRAYFNVELGDHCAAKNPGEFTRVLYADTLSQEGVDRLLALTAGDPEHTKDGRYALVASGSYLMNLLDQSEHAWRTCAEHLSNTKAFSFNSAVRYVFAKSELLVDGRVTPYARDGDVELYKVARNQDLRLRIHYFFPAQAASSQSLARLKVAVSPAFQVLGPTEQELDMVENRLDFPLALEPASDKRFGAVDFTFFTADADAKVVAAHGTVSLRIDEARWWWFLAVVVIALYTAGAVCSAAYEKLWGEILKGVALAIAFLVLRKKIV